MGNSFFLSWRESLAYRNEADKEKELVIIKKYLFGKIFKCKTTNWLRLKPRWTLDLEN